MSRNETIVNAFGTFLTTVIAAILAAYVPYRIVISEAHAAIPGMGNLRYIGPFFILMGIWGYLWSLRSFIFEAKGSPIPGLQENLMVNGLYRHVRNPLYVSAFLIIFGEAISFRSLHLLFYLAGWVVFFHLWVIFCEEPSLRVKFGMPFERYCQSVPRWLPRFRAPMEEDEQGVG